MSGYSQKGYAITKRVHVVEGAVKQRAKLAQTLTGMGISNEIYESLDELLNRVPSNGVILANDDGRELACESILSSMQSKGAYLPVIMYSNNPRPEQIVSAMLSGAIDYLTGPITSDVIDRAFTKLNGVAAHRLARERSSAAALKKTSALSRRELQVLRHVAQGLSTKAIAFELKISPRRVEIHRAHINSRLNVQSSAGAVRIAIYAGIDD